LANIQIDSMSATNGFLFAPFYEDKTYCRFIISPDIFTTSDKLPPLNFAVASNKKAATIVEREKIKAANKQDYVGYVKKIKAQINKGTFKKVVAARVIKKKLPADFNAVIYFRNLCEKYPSAFSSLVYTPQYGLWIGATPEILLTVNNKGFSTYSLAGTKANTMQNLNKAWGTKELQEQKIVSEYIVKAFKKIAKTQPHILGPETVVAGNLLHLRTTFTYKHLAKNKWPEVVAQLHPTPAVAGLPKKESIAFIIKHEQANRSFYTGYLGPINLDNEVNLFVNLRCMQVLKTKLAIYVGCGITSGSKPLDEWEEGKMKSQTLLSVLSAGKK